MLNHTFTILILMRPSLVLLLAVLFAAPALGQELVVARKALSGDEIELEDGRVLRIAGIKSDAPGAKDYLNALVSGKKLVLHERGWDRYGRLIAAPFLEEEARPVGQALLGEGMAFVYPAEGGGEVDAWLEAENKARSEKKGRWTVGPDTAARDSVKLVGGYGFVAGPVAKSARIKNKVFVSLGTGEGLTVVIAAKHLRPFKKRGIDALALPGRRVRVRGWVGEGPAITLSGPHQMELLD
jgi:hypothetical protein